MRGLRAALAALLRALLHGSAAAAEGPALLRLLPPPLLLRRLLHSHAAYTASVRARRHRRRRTALARGASSLERSVQRRVEKLLSGAGLGSGRGGAAGGSGGGGSTRGAARQGYVALEEEEEEEAAEGEGGEGAWAARAAAAHAAAPRGGAGGSSWAGSKEEWEAGAAEDEVPWSEAELGRELEAGVRRWAQPGEPRWEVGLLHEGFEILALLRATAALAAAPAPSGGGLEPDGGAPHAAALSHARLTFGEHAGPGAPLGGSGGLHAAFSRPEGFALGRCQLLVDGGGVGGDGGGDIVSEAEARRLGEALAFFEERVGSV